MAVQLSLQTMSHDGPAHDQPPRWNGAPSQDLLVIRRNHRPEVSLDPLRWGLIPNWPSTMA
jgi:putative SOS response-associated peptidase YedK